MAEPTWKAVWAVIESSQAYDDGLELGLRLLRATWEHRDKLGPRAYASNRIRLYRSILSMLEKAGRWGAYLRIWDAILALTGDLYVSVKGRSGDDSGAFAALIRPPSASGGVERGPYRAPQPLKVEAHFLHAQLSRKAVIVRRLSAERDAKASLPSAPPGGLPTEEIERRLTEAAAPGGVA